MQKKRFNYQSMFSFLLVGVQKFPLFDNLAKKTAPQNTIKIGVSARHFEKEMCVTKRPFLDNFFFFQQQKHRN